MKNEDIYKAALHLVGELNSEQTAWNADYLERSGYLLAMVCRQCEPVENLYRAANGQEAVTLPDQLCYLMTVTRRSPPPPRSVLRRFWWRTRTPNSAENCTIGFVSRSRRFLPPFP